jgi:hypothetical protein
MNDHSSILSYHSIGNGDQNVQPGFGFNKAADDSDYSMLSPLSDPSSFKCGNASASRVYLTETKQSFPFKNSTHDHLNGPMYNSDRKALQGFNERNNFK